MITVDEWLTRYRADPDRAALGRYCCADHAGTDLHCPFLELDDGLSDTVRAHGLTDLLPWLRGAEHLPVAELRQREVLA